jgi:hypothetical protein
MTARTKNQAFIDDLEAEVAMHRMRAMRLGRLYEVEFTRRKVLEVVDEYGGNPVLLQHIITEAVLPVSGNNIELIAIQPRDRLLYPSLDALMEALIMDPRTRAAFKRPKAKKSRTMPETPTPSASGANVH